MEKDLYSPNTQEENIDPSKKQEIRKFSKEHSSEERQQTADEIRSKRKEYFSNRETISNILDNLTSEKKEKEVEVESIIEKINIIESQIEDLKSNKISELLNYLKIKKLREDLEVADLEYGYKKENRDRCESYIKSLDEDVMNNQKKFNESYAILHEFYSNQSEKWQKFEKEKNDRSVKNIMNKYNCLFVHGILHDDVRERNLLLDKGKNIEWIDKFKILSALAPTISTSTIELSEFGSEKKLWSAFGVIINGGSVQSASKTDMGSIAEGLNVRTVSSEKKKENIEQQIDNAIKIKDKFYNELIVQNPEIAGIYFNFDKEGVIWPEYFKKIQELINIAGQMGTNVYALENGNLYGIEYDKKTENLQINGQPVAFKDILDQKYNMQETLKQKILRELFDVNSSPFSSAGLEKIASENK